MNETKHTPGPWEIESSGNGSLWVTGPDRNASVICDLLPRETLYTDEDMANAQLIAAAPNLLAELEGALPFVEAAVTQFSGMPGFATAVKNYEARRDAIRAVIAKAKGDA